MNTRFANQQQAYRAQDARKNKNSYKASPTPKNKPSSCRRAPQPRLKQRPLPTVATQGSRTSIWALFSVLYSVIVETVVAAIMQRAPSNDSSKARKSSAGLHS
jgi:hypothetical protein